MATEHFSYPPAVLSKLRETQLAMLQHFDTVCQKYGITYFAAFGTAIGAIRHHGFIPWDDDIDLGMMIDDYERLFSIPTEEWGKYKIENAENGQGYHRTVIARLYYPGTVFERSNGIVYDKPSCPKPIWIDIFVYGHVPDLESVKMRMHKMLRMQRLYWYAKVGMRRHSSDSLSFQIRCLRNDFIHKMMNLIARPELKIYNKFWSIIKQLDNQGKSGGFITTFECDVEDEMVNSYLHESDMFPVKRVPFENMEIPVLKDYHKMLTALYGDYMKLPSPEARFNHGAAVLDFGDGKNVVGDILK